MSGPASRVTGFPRLYAAASLKLQVVGPRAAVLLAFSAALCRGLIEARPAWFRSPPSPRFSAALCRGLIEASSPSASSSARLPGFPRLYAAASLKPGYASWYELRGAQSFPRLYAAASLKLRGLGLEGPEPRRRFPRLYAAASLKQALLRPPSSRPDGFSAALCRGLIEARSGGR